jgi:anaerobic selenocysteine-containing dehydrogenase
VVLYRVLGPSLDAQYGKGAASASLLWGAAQRCALSNPEAVRRAGYEGEGLEPGERLFEAIMSSPSGVVFSVSEHDDVWAKVGRRNDGRVRLDVPEMLAEMESLATEVPPGRDDTWPFVLSAGERRSSTANTIFREPAWRKKDADGALRINPADASVLGIVDGGLARITTKRGSAVTTVEITDMMQPGHVSLPNGLGVRHADGEAPGVAPNELTSTDDRDPIAGTPHHKHVRARLEAVSAS